MAVCLAHLFGCRLRISVSCSSKHVLIQYWEFTTFCPTILYHWRVASRKQGLPNSKHRRCQRKLMFTLFFHCCTVLPRIVASARLPPQYCICLCSNKYLCCQIIQFHCIEHRCLSHAITGINRYASVHRESCKRVTRSVYIIFIFHGCCVVDPSGWTQDRRVMDLNT